MTPDLMWDLERNYSKPRNLRGIALTSACALYIYWDACIPVHERVMVCSCQVCVIWVNFSSIIVKTGVFLKLGVIIRASVSLTVGNIHKQLQRIYATWKYFYSDVLVTKRFSTIYLLGAFRGNGLYRGRQRSS